jgi:hypothetical protein
LRCVGTFCIRRGEHPVARLLAQALRLPAEGNDLPTTLRVFSMDGIERWQRAFGGTLLTTTQRRLPNGLLAERFRCLELFYRVDRRSGSVHHEQVKVALCCGRLRITLPSWLAPKVSGNEIATSSPNRVRVQVEVRMPLIGLLVSYDGVVDMLETWP